MLVLTRKCEESVIIGNDIVVVVGKVSGGKVKLRVDAPRRVTVLRGELALPVDREDRQANARRSLMKIETISPIETMDAATGDGAAARRHEELAVTRTMFLKDGET